MTATRKNGARKRGRPAIGEGTSINVRMRPDQLAAVDTWAAAQEDAPTRPEAVRRLVDWGLKATVLREK